MRLMSMKCPPSRVLVAVLLLLAPATVSAQAPTAPPPIDDEPTPPSLKALQPATAPAGGGAPETSLRARPEAPLTPAPTGDVPDSYLPSLVGPIGLYGMSTAEVGPLNHLRLALHGQYFTSSGFLVQGDDNSRMNGNFSFGFTPHQYVEIFGAMLTSSNRNT